MLARSLAASWRSAQASCNSGRTGFPSPKLVGGRVGLHPVWLMFALFAFGYVFGFVGLLLAVPLAAAAGVLVRFALRKYLSSPIYLGTSAAASRAGRRTK